MARAEPRAPFDVRPGGIWDGVPQMLSYVLFTTLERRAPGVSKWAVRTADGLRKRAWLVGTADTPHGALRVAHLGPPDRFARWFMDRLGATRIRAVSGSADLVRVPCDVELTTVPAADAVARGRDGWLVVPRYVHHRQDLSAEPSAQERRVESRARANRFIFRFSQSLHDLESFRRDLYEPMLERRHGANALRTGRALLALGQWRGGLFLVESNGRAVSGAVAAPAAASPGDLEIWALGVAEDAPPGSDLAPVLAWIRWARERGYEAVDHLVTVPLFSDGLARHKMRWGTEVREPRAERDVLALRVHGSTPALESWLARHSFAARSRAGLVKVEVRSAEELDEAARALAGS